MNSAHSGGLKRRSKGAQFGGDGSMDWGCIEMQDNATRFVYEVTSSLLGREGDCFTAYREGPIEASEAFVFSVWNGGFQVCTERSPYRVRSSLPC
jgi:hypothetical protein